MYGKKKSIYQIIRTSLIIVVVFSLFSCGNRKKAIHLIPKQANCVVEVNLPKIVEKAMMSVVSGHTINLNGFLAKKVQPEKLGLSIAEKSYIFLYDSIHPKFGIAAMLDSRLKFEDYIRSVGKEVFHVSAIKEVNKEIKSCQFSSRGLALWDKKKVLFLIGKSSDTLQVAPEHIAFFDQEKTLPSLPGWF